MSAAPAYHMDAITERAGAANSRAFGGVQKRYNRALRVHKSTGSRHFKGENAPTTKFLFQIATADKATAYPIIAEAIAIVNQEQISAASSAQLYARLAELNEIEHEADANGDRQTLRACANPTPEQLEAAATADVHVGEITLERAAVLREIAERKRRGAL